MSLNIRELKQRPVVLQYDLFEHYDQLGLNEADLIIMIKLIYCYETTSEQPSIPTLQKGTSLSEAEITQMIQKFIQLGLLSMKVNKNESGKFTEYINLDGFYEQLVSVLNNIDQQNQKLDKKEHFKQIFSKIEQTFGRALSPLEIEHLNQWIDVDGYSLDIIEAAIDEALAHEKYSLKYIDRILLNWKKNNVTEVEDTKPIRAQFKKSSPQETQSIDHFPKFNWLKGEDPFDK